jgi:uncharacterized DUF497 family protein
MVVIDRIEWDDWSIEHIARHRVTREDVEAACYGDPIEFRQSYKSRIVVLGPAVSGRIIAVVIGQVPHRPEGIYYVFTARPADKAEERFYRQWQEGTGAS